MEEKEFYKELGEQFRVLREEKGVKQSEIASQIGVRSSLLSEFENQGVKISAFRLNQIFKILTGQGLFEKKTSKLTLPFVLHIREQ